jgi:hypothetical protein
MKQYDNHTVNGIIGKLIIFYYSPGSIII